MLTVKQVATALGIDERSVRDKLALGTLKGTKKTIGQRDQWFVHQRDLDAELARRGQSPINQPQVAEQSSMPPESAVPPFISTSIYQSQAGPAQGYFAPPQQPAAVHQYLFAPAPQPPDGQVPPVMTAHYQTGAVPPTPEATVQTALKQPAQETAAIEPNTYEDITDATILETLADSAISEKESTASETSRGSHRSWRNEDLEEQVTAAAERILKPMMDRVQELTKELVLKDLQIEEMDKQLKLLPDFEAQKKKLLDEIEAERKAAEIQFNKVKEKEEEAQALEAENELLKQKAEEAVLSAAKLAELEKVVLELQKPKPTIWQKLFGGEKG